MLNNKIIPNYCNNNDYKMNWIEKEIMQFSPADIRKELLTSIYQKIAFYDKICTQLIHHILIFVLYQHQ